jgi:hypothetical protein
MQQLLLAEQLPMVSLIPHEELELVWVHKWVFDWSIIRKI